MTADHAPEHRVSAVSAPDLRRARRGLLWVGIAAPAVLTAVAVALIAAWLPQLPDPAATHWGVGGVNGVGAPVTYVWLALGVGFVVPALLTVATVAGARRRWGGAARMLGAFALGLSGLSGVTNAGSVMIQRGLARASDVGGIGVVLVTAVVVFAALVAIGWLVQPRVRPEPAVSLRPAHVAAVSAGERVVWLATASMGRAMMIVSAVIMVGLAGVVAVTAVQAVEQLWIPLLTLVVVGVAFASSASFRVRVGPDGLTVWSQLGVPRVHVSLADVVDARAVDCTPFGEFGGYGWRLGLDGRTGIVLRTGPALEVARRGKRTLVVTVDGAAVGAALLQAYRRRAGSTRTTADDGPTHDEGMGS